MWRGPSGRIPAVQELRPLTEIVGEGAAETGLGAYKRHMDAVSKQRGSFGGALAK